MNWIMEPLNGFKTIGTIFADDGCTSTWSQCNCAFGLATCSCSSGLVVKHPPEEPI